MYSRTEGRNPPRCLSDWRRRAIITSASSTARSRLVSTSTGGIPLAGDVPAQTPARAGGIRSGGISVGGPDSTTRAPIRVKPQILERATRLCSTSPTITILRPWMPLSGGSAAIIPVGGELTGGARRDWTVYKSSRAWVGWAWRPSPALTTLTRSRRRARKLGAPEWGCRTTRVSTPMACRVRPVLSRDSPLSELLPAALMLMTSALSTLPASSKDMRVRVLAS